MQVQRRPELRLSKAATADLNRSQMNFVVSGRHSFRCVEDEAYLEHCQKLVDLGSTYGKFDVKKHLVGRNSVSTGIQNGYETSKAALVSELEPAVSQKAVALAADLATDNYIRRCYLDLHASWIDQNFKYHNCILAVRHFGIETHIAEHILEVTKELLKEFGLDLKQTPIVTDKGSNVVAAFDPYTRLSCLAHRLHNCFSGAWDNTKANLPEAAAYEDGVARLCYYAKTATGVQEQLPTSLKHGGNTRPWTSMHERADAIEKSYDTLKELLREKKREQLILDVSRSINREVMEISAHASTMFKLLQVGNSPSIQNCVPVYYLLREECCASYEIETNVVHAFKENFLAQLDEKFFKTLNPYHYIGAFLDPSFKTFSFLPNTTKAQRKDKLNLQEDLRVWAKRILTETYPGGIVFPAEPAEPRLPNVEPTDPLHKFRKYSRKDPAPSADQGFASLEKRLHHEMETYLAQPVEEEDTVSILSFWKSQKKKFPLLTKLALKVLPIPASSAHSERDFSGMNLTITKLRSRLSPKNVECIEFLNGHKRHVARKALEV